MCFQIMVCTPVINQISCKYMILVISPNWSCRLFKFGNLWIKTVMVSGFYELETHNS